MANVLITSALFVAAVGCAGGGQRTQPAEQPAAKKKPKRPPRRPGFGPGGQKPGQAELEAAIEAAKAEDLERAKEKAAEAIEANPRLEQAYLLLGSACAMQGDLTCERNAYERGLEVMPQSAELLRAMGLLHLQQGEIDRALARYEAANDITGSRKPEFMADLAYAYVYADRVEDARALAEKALALDSRCFTCAMSLGQASLSGEAYEAALDAYQTAANIAPNDFDARLGLAKAHFLAGNPEEASELYEGLVEENPEDGRLRVQAAQVAMKAKRFERAVAHLEVVAEANPGQEALLRTLLKAQRAAGDKEGAQKTRARLKKLN